MLSRVHRRSFLGLGGVAILVAACAPAPKSALASPSAGPAARPTSAPGQPATPTAAILASPVPTVVPTSTAPATTTPSAAAAAAVVPAATATLAPIVPAVVAGRPDFSDVSQATPADVVAFLQGRHPRYPGSDPSKVLDFSASDILETMDTIVLDQVRQIQGDAALQKIYDVIAGDVLATLRGAYGDHWVLVPLDAGHGGKKGYFWDPGSEGTEAEHTRAVVATIFRQVEQPINRRILLRRVYNDDVADDFGLGSNQTRATISSTLMRQARSAMLALEARAWNAANPDPPSQVYVHEVSMHFNAGAGGALVLHQGDTVQATYQARSVDFARRYLQRVVPDLNATGLLPSLLTLWAGTGLHDDVMMYRPAYLTNNPAAANLTLRYGALQGTGYMPRFIQMLLSRSPLAAGTAAAPGGANTQAG